MWLLTELKDRKASAAPAIICRERILTYHQLWEQSEKIAEWMQHNLHTKAPILIYGNKNVEILSVMVAALKVGRAYVPVDITFPRERLKRIREITEAEAVFNFSSLDLTEMSEDCFLMGQADYEWIMEQPVTSDMPSDQWVQDDDICYILFTSGSTGDPKGVQITKSNILNFVAWFSHYAKVPEGAVALNQVSYSFDVSVIQIYIYLAAGVTLFSIDKNMIEDFGLLFEYLKDSNISTWVSTPAFIEMCAVYNSFNSTLLSKLQKIILAGEVLTKKLTKTLWDKFPGVQVINGYGPTEGTVLLTCCEITKEMVDDDKNGLPIGEIIDDGVYWLEDSDHRRIESSSDKGELVVCSRSISRGYFKNPEITAKHFFNSEAGWAYRTGDFVYVIGKNIYYCGRIDFQVKLNGYRIELDDISSNLNKVPQVANNVVLPVYRDGRVAYIAAFVVLSQETTESSLKMGIRIRKSLAERIPSYMVPKKVIVLPEFPLNTNGKIDRKKLTEKYL